MVVKEGDGGGGGGVVVIARRITLMEKMSGSPDRCDPFTGLTLEAILANEKPLTSSAPTSRTLLDIIRDEDPDSKIFSHNKDRKCWKHFRDGLRIKQAAATWTNLATGDLTTHHLKDSVAIKNKGPRQQFTRRSSSRVSSSSSDPECTSCGGDGSLHVSSSSRTKPQFSRQNWIRVAKEAREQSRRLTVALAKAQQQTAPRTSLMELLEETDMQMSVKGPRRYILSDDEDEEEEEEYVDCEEEEEEEDFKECEADEEEVEDENGGGEREKKCCVCMARNRGAAFIPCGHTFCRLCSRELRANRGNCPLCNASILEILYIF